MYALRYRIATESDARTKGYGCPRERLRLVTAFVELICCYCCEAYLFHLFLAEIPRPKIRVPWEFRVQLRPKSVNLGAIFGVGSQ